MRIHIKCYDLYFILLHRKKTSYPRVTFIIFVNATHDNVPKIDKDHKNNRICFNGAIDTWKIIYMTQHQPKPENNLKLLTPETLLEYS